MVKSNELSLRSYLSVQIQLALTLIPYWTAHTPTPFRYSTSANGYRRTPSSSIRRRTCWYSATMSLSTPDRTRRTLGFPPGRPCCYLGRQLLWSGRTAEFGRRCTSNQSLADIIPIRELRLSTEYIRCLLLSTAYWNLKVNLHDLISLDFIWLYAGTSVGRWCIDGAEPCTNYRVTSYLIRAVH